MKGWARRPLAQLASRISDGSHNPPKGVELSDYMMLSSKNVFDDQLSFANPRYLSAADFKTEDRRTSVAAGDVLLTIVGTIGRTAVVPHDAPAFTLQRSVAVIRPDSTVVDSRFLMYSLMNSSEALNAQARGVAQKGIYLEALREFGIDHPPIREQRRIVAILDEAFKAIATAKANTEKNLQNARDMFVDYLKSVFLTGGTDWTVNRVGALADCCLGKMLDKAKNKGELRPYLRNLNVRWFAFDLTDLKEMRFTLDECERYSVRRGDVVVCEGGYPGRAAVWEGEEPILIQKALHRVRFGDATKARWFLYYLYSLEASGELRRHFSGTGIQHFTGMALSRLSMPLAPNSIAVSIVERIDRLSNSVTRFEAVQRNKLAALDELKKSLLHQAFTGQLTTEFHEKQLAEAT